METKKITPSRVLRSKEYANILKATLMEIRASHEIPASKGLVFRRSIYDSLKNELFVEGIEKTFPKTYKSIKEKRDRIHNPGAETHSSPIGVGGRKAPIPLVSKLFSNMRKI